jgi:hypothetical protein
MKITIGAYTPATRTVAVRFEHDGVTYDRPVNACHDQTGAYDAAATADRVDQVALGVTTKIELGVVTTPEPAADPVVDPAPANAAGEAAPAN